MNILVTGATGFLGGALARQLHHHGYTVSGIGRNKEKGRLLERDGISFVSADLRNAAEISKSCSGKDWVFHADVSDF